MGTGSEGVFDKYVASVTYVRGTAWAGAAAEAAQSRATADRNTVRKMADTLELISSKMVEGYHAITAPLNRAKLAIIGAEAAGFEVSEFLAVTKAGNATEADRIAAVNWHDAIAQAANDTETADTLTQSALAEMRSAMKLQFEGISASVTSASERRFRDIRHWMYVEMMRNASSEIVQRINGQNKFARESLSDREWYEFWKDPQAGANSQMSAYAAWFERVAPSRPWDHKPILREEFGDTAEGDYDGDYYFQEPGTNRQVYYDIWSNVHFGYVGRAAGFDSETLMEGQNFGPDFLTGQKARADDISTEFGARLHDQYGPNMTEDQFNSAITGLVEQLAEEKSTGTDMPHIEYGSGS
ncbi:hypothetical protein G3I13_19860 [Streptomyces sp. SID6673]|nr:hypothetical protein [Streptomyces sp. SID11726]NEB26594.1 hypothetical protein [Streptomyces sp. SID6673]